MAIQQESETARSDPEASRSEGLSGKMRSNAIAGNSMRLRFLADLFDESQTLSKHDGGPDTGG